MGHYPRLPDFPTHVIEVLENGNVNLFEAGQLARVTDERLGVTRGQAKSRRGELLSSDPRTKTSGERLRLRVHVLLRASAAQTGESTAGEMAATLKELEGRKGQTQIIKVQL